MNTIVRQHDAALTAVRPLIEQSLRTRTRLADRAAMRLALWLLLWSTARPRTRTADAIRGRHRTAQAAREREWQRMHLLRDILR